MFEFEKDFETFFSLIGNEKKEKRFLSLIKEKNLLIEDLELIFQTVKPKTSGSDSEIWRVKSTALEKAIVVTVNKGNGTSESPMMSAHQWWTKEGAFIGETL